MFDNRFKKIAKIGQGAFGNVYLCQDSKDNQLEEQKDSISDRRYVAIKRIKKQFDKEEKLEEIREIQSLNGLKNGNIIEISDVFVYKNCPHMVLEYCPADLSDFLAENHKKLDYDDKKTILYQILKALAFIHDQGYYHRDMKTSNMLLTRKGMIKLCDFGLTKKYDANTNATRHVVTRWYRAPEIIYGSSSYDQSIDMWGFGCIAAELFKGDALFPGSTDIEQLGRIFEVLGGPNEENWPGCSELPIFIPFEESNPIGFSKIEGLEKDEERLLKRLLVLDPKKRMTAKEGLEDGYFKGVKEVEESGYAKLLEEVYERKVKKYVNKKG